MKLSSNDLKVISEQVKQDGERDRRVSALKRHKIYKDGGKEFLLEQVRREFNEDAVKEMRLSPINILKKIVNIKSQIYKRSPIRKSEQQELVDFYVDSLSLDVVMAKCNRYYNLFSNTQIYAMFDGNIKLDVVPPYLYSLIPSKLDLSKIEGVCFSTFNDDIMDEREAAPPTGNAKYSENKSYNDTNSLVKWDGKQILDKSLNFIWTDETYAVVNSNGQIMESAVDDMSNPYQIIPSVTVAKDRDNETYSTVGNDMIDLTMLIQLGWSDLLTIAKHQGFSLLTMTGPEPPEKITMGINRAIWLKQEKEGPTPSIDYVTANSPLEQYKGLLIEQLAMLLSSNDINPKAVGGTFAAQNATSGFHALIENADTMEAIEQDKPVLMKAELELWEVIKAMHNFHFDNGTLSEEATALGKFDDSFSINIQYQDLRPLQSDQEVISNVKNLLADGLMSKKQAIKKLNPTMTDEEVQALMDEIQAEKSSNVQSFMQGGNFQPQGDSQQ